jgi:hypothetical protein
MTSRLRKPLVRDDPHSDSVESSEDEEVQQVLHPLGANSSSSSRLCSKSDNDFAFRSSENSTQDDNNCEDNSCEDNSCEAKDQHVEKRVKVYREVIIID